VIASDDRAAVRRTTGEITPLLLRFVNCYLIHTGAGHVLVDTGFSVNRRTLVHLLEAEGCRPDNLELVILTHGDFDHAGNAAFLQAAYQAPIAMHPADAGMVELGDMSWGRTSNRLLLRGFPSLMRIAFPRTGRFERFVPDLLVDDGDDLSGWGVDGTIVHMPGHSAGSIGVLMGDGDLIGGDLLSNDKAPRPQFADDRAAMAASISRLRSLGVGTVYPGHGHPFRLDELGRD
jgi:glyoxylase-like metal-dependent hydrolase (beta-lactamase superfamily II)